MKTRLQHHSESLAMSALTSSEAPVLVPYSYIRVLIPSLYSNLEKIELIIKGEQHINPALERYESLMSIWSSFRSLMDPLEQEIAPFCAEEWESENRVDEGKVCSHIISVIIVAFIDPVFKLLDEHDQSVVLFACLLHDIAKKGPPEIETKDPFHPFTSASKALQILNRLGWIPHPEAVQETVDYINASCFYHKWAYFMDNRRLPGIYKRLLYVTGIVNSVNAEFSTYFDVCQGLERGKLFCFEIIALVLLHQSVDLDEKFPNFTPLSQREIIKFLTPRLLRLLELLHKGDSGSYYLPCRNHQWDFLKRNERAIKSYIKLFSS